MITSVNNQNDAYKLKEEFCRWLEEERGILCCDTDIAVTGDTVDSFAQACVEMESCSDENIMDEYPDLSGGRVYEMTKTQRAKGERRKDLYILDTGKYRLVYVS